MVIAGVVNYDGATIYQALKIIVIAGIFVAMWWMVLRAQWRQLMTALYWVVGLMAVSLALTVDVNRVLAIGSRHGSSLAAYGVLWKVGALFLPLFVSDFIVRPKARKINALMATLCACFVMLDGSRTAQLVVLATLTGLLVFLGWGHGWWSLFKKSRWWLLLLIAAAMLILSIGENQFSKERPTNQAVTGAASLINKIEGGFTKTFRTRFGKGDPARIKLLRVGVQQSIACLPVGCGFGKTATEVKGGTIMPVHNAYLAALGDFGVLGLLGMLGFVLAACLPIRRVMRRAVDSKQDYYVVAVAGSALGYVMALMLNTFTTEMSEWGYLMVMLAFAWAPAKAA